MNSIKNISKQVITNVLYNCLPKLNNYFKLEYVPSDVNINMLNIQQNAIICLYSNKEYSDINYLKYDLSYYINLNIIKKIVKEKVYNVKNKIISKNDILYQNGCIYYIYLNNNYNKYDLKTIEFLNNLYINKEYYVKNINLFKKLIFKWCDDKKNRFIFQ